MIRPFFVFLAPLGCLLMLLFTSLTPFRMMTSIGKLLQSEPGVADVTSIAPVGGVGAVMFGLGMMFLALVKRKPRIIARVLFGVAALLMVAGAASNAFADWLMMSAFRDLATAETIDSERFLASFRSAKLPILLGYSLVVIASLIVASAASMMEAKSRFSRTSATIAAISFALLLLAVYWSQSSMLPLSQIVASEQVDPSTVAGSMNGALRSDFLYQTAILGFAMSTLVVAISRRKHRS